MVGLLPSESKPVTEYWEGTSIIAGPVKLNSTAIKSSWLKQISGENESSGSSSLKFLKTLVAKKAVRYGTYKLYDII